MSDLLKAPFPWFGGKSRAAPIIWPRFGDVPNYVEPFAGSLATLLLRPHPPRTETVNDLDCYLANFWRAIACDPEGVAQAADWPVNEADLTARHRWLMAQSCFRDRMRAESDYFDSKVAGWWVWGLCAWIGSGWCVQRRNGNQPEQIPHLGNAGRGIADYFSAFSDRLRKVRVACGEWDRVLSEACTTKHGVTAVFLDPPYTDGDLQYSAGGCGGALADSVREWAIVNGENPLLRIALCGYEGEHVMPVNWECVEWKARKGYQSSESAIEDRRRERIWFSPACLKPHDDLFAVSE
jgi:site-specific DNA-adenine methylase